MDRIEEGLVSFHEPLVLALIFLGVTVLAAAGIVAYVRVRFGKQIVAELRYCGASLADIHNAVATSEAERNRISDEISEAVSSAEEQIHRRINLLGRATGLVPDGPGWVRPTHIKEMPQNRPGPVMGMPSVMDATDDEITDDLIEHHQRNTPGVGFLPTSATNLNLLRIPGLSLYWPEDIGQDGEQSNALWRFLEAQTGVEHTVALWETHPKRTNWSWYEYLRTWLIKKYEFALLPDIEAQFFRLSTDEAYVAWKRNNEAIRPT